METMMKKKTNKNSIKGQEGSVILIVIILLALLTVGGISATNLSVTESFITRNNAIHKQNLQLAELSAMEGLRRIMSENNPAELLPGTTSQAWIHNRKTWNSCPTVAAAANSAVPNSVTGNDIDIISQRGEPITSADSPMRYYFVGWSPSPLNSLTMTGGASWRTGKVIGVYNSDQYGFEAVELGVLRRF